MMKWYRVYWGTWRDPEKRGEYDFGFYQFGTYSRDKAFKAAQETANEKNVTVTVSSEWSTGSGMTSKFYDVRPSV